MKKEHETVILFSFHVPCFSILWFFSEDGKVSDPLRGREDFCVPSSFFLWWCNTKSHISLSSSSLRFYWFFILSVFLSRDDSFQSVVSLSSTLSPFHWFVLYKSVLYTEKIQMHFSLCSLCSSLTHCSSLDHSRNWIEYEKRMDSEWTEYCISSFSHLQSCSFCVLLSDLFLLFLSPSSLTQKAAQSLCLWTMQSHVILSFFPLTVYSFVYVFFLFTAGQIMKSLCIQSEKWG